MKTIFCKKRHEVKVDNEYYQFLVKRSWKCQPGGLYDSETNLPMGAFIINVPVDMEVDHRDRNTHNCQKCNLRPATPSQNRANRVFKNSNGYKGVAFDYRDGKYQASIQKDGKRYHLGRFKTAEKAALAYNEAATELHGEFAVLNTINL